jgi:hypothetical protein
LLLLSPPHATQSFAKASKKHTVVYDDGDKEAVALDSEKWERVEETAPAQEQGSGGGGGGGGEAAAAAAAGPSKGGKRQQAGAGDGSEEQQEQQEQQEQEEGTRATKKLKLSVKPGSSGAKRDAGERRVTRQQVAPPGGAPTPKPAATPASPVTSPPKPKLSAKEAAAAEREAAALVGQRINVRWPKGDKAWYAGVVEVSGDRGATQRAQRCWLARHAQPALSVPAGRVLAAGAHALCPARRHPTTRARRAMATTSTPSATTTATWSSSTSRPRAASGRS